MTPNEIPLFLDKKRSIEYNICSEPYSPHNRYDQTQESSSECSMAQKLEMRDHKCIAHMILID